jgi:putative endonuclease
VRFLERKGLRRVARNFGTRRGEIDLVMLDGACVSFIEVRYRDCGSYASAALTVDRHKQRRIAAAAAEFLAKHPDYADRVCRFDVVGVDRDAGGELQIHWIRDAFRLAE